MDERFGRFAQNLILTAQVPVLAQTAARLLTHLRQRDNKIMTAWATGHGRTMPYPYERRRSLH